MVCVGRNPVHALSVVVMSLLRFMSSYQASDWRASSEPGRSGQAKAI